MSLVARLCAPLTLILGLFCIAALGCRMTGATGDDIASMSQPEAGTQGTQEPASPSMPSPDARVQVFEARSGQWVDRFLRDVGGNSEFLYEGALFRT